MSEAAEKRIAELERDLRGTQEMLFQVLYEVGEPVIVSKATLQEGIKGDKMIDIEIDEENDAFIFKVVNINEQ